MASSSEHRSLPVSLTKRYRPLRRLGEGGFGFVDLCHDEHLNRVVALKCLHEAGDDELRRRFLQEARVTAQLRHPNVVDVLDFGVADERWPYITYEFVDGPTLHDLAHGADTPAPSTVAFWGRQLAEALSCAHAGGVVHRDVKPQNVLVRPDGGVVLVDFGIARTTDQGTQLTATGILVGTPAFMAPELFTGARATAACDQFSAAATMVFAATGSTIYGSTDLATVCERVRQGRPLALPPTLAGMKPLAAALRRATSYCPEDRFPDMHAFAAALTEAEAWFVERREVEPFVFPTVQAGSGARVATTDGQAPTVRRGAWTRLVSTATALRHRRVLLAIVFGTTVIAALTFGLGRSTTPSAHPPPALPVVPAPTEPSRRLPDGPFTNSLGMTMLPILPGTFMMGAGAPPDKERTRPVHEVSIGYRFFMAETETTWGQFDDVVGTMAIRLQYWRPQRLSRRPFPADNVDWQAARTFCEELTVREWRNGTIPRDWCYRLPSEAEWEYACRAGTSGATYAARLDDIAWHVGLAELGMPTQLPRQKQPNAFGLYDMLGNVYEWTADTWHGNYTGAPTDGSAWVDRTSTFGVRRGGSCESSPVSCSAFWRTPEDEDQGWAGRNGFRPVLARR